MIVECNRCHSRYRMKRSVLKGSRGAKVRCRKCGETFVVLNPRPLSGTDSPVAVAGATVRQVVPSLPREKVRPDTTGESMPPAQVRKEAPPAPKIVDLHDGISGEVPAPNIPEEESRRVSVPTEPPAKGPAVNFDLSGLIRPAPVLVPEEEKPADPVSRPVEEPPKERAADRPALESRPTGWKEVEINDSSSGMSRSVPTRSRMPIHRDPKTTQVQSFFSNSSHTNLWHIALVYLALLLLGGCGYLVLRLLWGVLPVR